MVESIGRWFFKMKLEYFSIFSIWKFSHFKLVCTYWANLLQIQTTAWKIDGQVHKDVAILSLLNIVNPSSSKVIEETSSHSRSCFWHQIHSSLARYLPSYPRQTLGLAEWSLCTNGADFSCQPCPQCSLCAMNSLSSVIPWHKQASTSPIKLVCLSTPCPQITRERGSECRHPFSGPESRVDTMQRTANCGWFSFSGQ